MAPMTRLSALVLLGLVLGSAASAAEPGPRPVVTSCLGVAGAQQALRDGRARPLAEVRRRVDGELLRADLCFSGDVLVYRLTLLENRGRVRRLLLDAGSGRVMYDAP